MLRYARMTITNNPLFTELRALFVVEFSCNYIKRLWGSGGLGKGHSNCFSAKLAGTEAVHTAVKVHSEKSSWFGLRHPQFARSILPPAQSGAPGEGIP